MKITQEFVTQLDLQPDSIYRIWLTNNNIPHLCEYFKKRSTEFTWCDGELLDNEFLKDDRVLTLRGRRSTFLKKTDCSHVTNVVDFVFTDY